MDVDDNPQNTCTTSTNEKENINMSQITMNVRDEDDNGNVLMEAYRVDENGEEENPTSKITTVPDRDEKEAQYGANNNNNNKPNKTSTYVPYFQTKPVAPLVTPASSLPNTTASARVVVVVDEKQCSSPIPQQVMSPSDKRDAINAFLEERKMSMMTMMLKSVPGKLAAAKVFLNHGSATMTDRDVIEAGDAMYSWCARYNPNSKEEQALAEEEDVPMKRNPSPEFGSIQRAMEEEYSNQSFKSHKSSKNPTCPSSSSSSANLQRESSESERKRLREAKRVVVKKREEEEEPGKIDDAKLLEDLLVGKYQQYLTLEMKQNLTKDAEFRTIFLRYWQSRLPQHDKEQKRACAMREEKTKQQAGSVSNIKLKMRAKMNQQTEEKDALLEALAKAKEELKALEAIMHPSDKPSQIKLLLHLLNRKDHFLTQHKFALENHSLCIVCKEEARSVHFQPCAHLVCCATCARKVPDCPVCRRAIASIHLCFFS